MAYDDVLVRLAGVDGSQLPPLVPTGSVIGPVLPEVAAELGIPATAVAVTGLPDLHSAAVGAGAIRLGEPHASIGTTAWISAPVAKKKTDVFRQQASVPGLDDASYLLANNQDSAGRNLQWWRDAVAPEASYDDLLAEAAAAAPGAGGVVFTPWLTGERSPVDDRNARAGFHGVGETATRGDLTRAVLEGVAANFAWLLGAAEKFVGTRLDDIRLVGGGARSDLWCQVLADATDRTIVRVTDPWLAGLRGSALVRRAGAGCDRARRGAITGAHRRAVPSRPAQPGDVRRARRPSCRSCTAPRRASSAGWPPASGTPAAICWTRAWTAASPVPKLGSLSWATEYVPTSRFAVQCAAATGSWPWMNAPVKEFRTESSVIASEEVSVPPEIPVPGSQDATWTSLPSAVTRLLARRGSRPLPEGGLHQGGVAGRPTGEGELGARRVAAVVPDVGVPSPAVGGQRGPG